MRARVIEGVAQLDCGECADWKLDEITADGRTLLAHRQAAA
jgi:hypothetical protein